MKDRWLMIAHRGIVVVSTHWHICDEMVDIVAALPPANRQAAAEVGDEHADERVNNKDLGDGSMPGIMGCEHDLVL